LLLFFKKEESCFLKYQLELGKKAFFLKKEAKTFDHFLTSPNHQ